ncbi:MAG: hypothetical protein RI897_2714 [Verrucomicrobiota bacterium]
MTLVAAPRILRTAPVPRPPQPMTPTRMGSSAAACEVMMKGSWEAALAAARVRVEFLRKWRREEWGVVGEGFCMGCRVAMGWW